jgi:hypothetical protein
MPSRRRSITSLSLEALQQQQRRHRGNDSRMEFNLASGLEILERTPAVIRSMLSNLSPEWLDGTEGPDTWSPYVIVGHLIHGERTDWIPRARIILAQGEDRRFKPFDRFAQFRESEGKSLAQLLDEFATLRSENLGILAHDLGHIAQTARVMAKQYREAVGPWRAYLPVMDR